MMKHRAQLALMVMLLLVSASLAVAQQALQPVYAARQLYRSRQRCVDAHYGHHGCPL